MKFRELPFARNFKRAIFHDDNNNFLILLNRVLNCFSHVQLFATQWTIACQAPLSMEFSRQEYWGGLLFPTPGDFPNQEMEPVSPVLQAASLLSETPGKPVVSTRGVENSIFQIEMTAFL